jgi:hypothetical protein
LEPSNDALGKADKASKLEEQDGHAAEAAKLMHEAATEYPQATGLGIAARMYEEGAAFERKDYDAFLSIAEGLWKAYSGPSTGRSGRKRVSL